jgi:hypothetical protein
VGWVIDRGPRDTIVVGGLTIIEAGSRLGQRSRRMSRQGQKFASLTGSSRRDPAIELTSSGRSPAAIADLNPPQRWARV